MKRTTPLAAYSLGLIAGCLIAQTALLDLPSWFWVLTGLVAVAGLVNAIAATFPRRES